MKINAKPYAVRAVESVPLRCRSRLSRKIRNVVLAGLCVVALSASAVAPTPLAVWDEDFTSAPTGWSLDLCGNKLADGGTAIVITNDTQSGVRFSRENYITVITVVVRYSGMETPSWNAPFAVVSAAASASSTDMTALNRVGVLMTSQAKTLGYWQNKSWSNSGAHTSDYPISSGNGRFALRYDSRDYGSDAGTWLFVDGVTGWTTNYYATGLMAKGTKVYGVAVGGAYKDDGCPEKAFKGLKIHSVAIFNEALGVEELSQFQFESEKPPLIAETVAGGAYASWDGLPWPQAWENNALCNACVSNGTSTTSVSLSSDVVCRALSFAGDGTLSISGNGHAVSSRVFDASMATGHVLLDFDTADTYAVAGADTVFTYPGTGALSIPYGSVATVTNGWLGEIEGGGLFVKTGGGQFEPLGGYSSFTGSWEVAEGSLILDAGSEGNVDVDAGATLKLRLNASQMAGGYTAAGVSLADSSAHLVFILLNGTEVPGDSGTYVPSSNTWSAQGVTGNWSDANRWSLGAKPSAGDNVVIEANGNVTLVMDEDSPVLNSISVVGSGTLAVTGAKLSATVFSAERPVDCAVGTFSAGHISLTDGASLRCRTASEEVLEVPNGIEGGALTVSGAGAVSIGSGSGSSVSGTCVRVESGSLQFSGSLCDTGFEICDGASIDATGAISSTGTLSISNGTEKTVFASAQSLVGERLSKLGVGELIFGCGAAISVRTEIGNGTLSFRGDSALSGTVTGVGGIHAVTGTVALSGTLTYAGATVIDVGGTVATSTGGFSPSGFSGSGVAEFRTLMPNEASLAVLTDATKWQGICWLRNIEEEQKNINPDSYANASSKVKLTGMRGYFPQATTCGVEVILSDDGVWGKVTAFRLTGGYSNDRFAFVFNKLSGDGSFYDDSANTRQIIRILDGSEFSGSVTVSGQRVVFGTDPVSPNVVIKISSDASLTLPYGSTFVNTRSDPSISDGIVVAGYVCIEVPTQLQCGGASNLVADSGVVELKTYKPFGERPYSDGSYTDFRSYSGDGTIKFSGVGYRLLGSSASLYPAETLAFCNEQNEGIMFGDGANETVIGSLSGAGMIRTDSRAGQRTIRIYQRANTEWSGVAGGTEDRLRALSIDGDPDAAARTLTISGNNTVHSNKLEVLTNGRVNLSGTWKGDVEVCGAFGGSGSVVNGLVTFTAGATLDAASGAPTLPAVGGWPASLTVNVPASLVGAEEPIKVISCSSLPSLNGVDVSFVVDWEHSRHRFLLVGKSDGLYVRHVPYGAKFLIR